MNQPVAVLINDVGGTIDANGSGTLTIETGNTITNAGLIEATTGDLTIDDAVTNTGTLESTEQSLTLSGAVSNAGGRIVAAGGDVVVDGQADDGTLSATEDGQITINGSVASSQVDATSGGAVDVVGDVTSGAFDASGVDSNGSASTILIGGAVIGGTLRQEGAGVIMADGGDLFGNTLPHIAGKPIVFNSVTNLDTLTISGADSATFLSIGGMIVNSGTFLLDGSAAQASLLADSVGVTLEGGGRIVMTNGGQNVIDATASGVTLTNVNNTISGNGSLGDHGLVLVNKGLIDATGGSPLFVELYTKTASVNAGTMEATGGGELQFVSGTFTNTKTVVAGAASTVDFDRSMKLTNLSGGTLTGGSWSVGTSALFILGGSTALTTDAATISLSGAGSLFESGTAATILEQSLTTIAKGGALTLVTRNYTTPKSLSVAGTLTLNASTLTLAAAGAETLAVQSGGIVSLVGIASIAATRGTSGGLSVKGTVLKTGTGIATVGVTTNNSGTILAENGMLDFKAAVANAGNATIESGAILEFDAAVGAQAVTFSTGGGELKLNDAPAFAGSVAKLGAGDTIDIGHFGKGTTATYAPNSKNTGGTLTLKNGSASTKLTLVGSYSSKGFKLTTGISGDTLLTYAPPKASARPEAAMATAATSSHEALLAQALFDAAFDHGLSALSDRGSGLASLSHLTTLASTSVDLDGAWHGSAR